MCGFCGILGDFDASANSECDPDGGRALESQNDHGTQVGILVAAEDVAGVDFILNVVEDCVVAVGDNGC